MKTKKIIIELQYSAAIENAHLSMTNGDVTFASSALGLPKFGSLKIDDTFGLVQIPHVKKIDPFDSATDMTNYSSNQVEVKTVPADSTYIVRAVVDENKIDKAVEDLMNHADVKGVFADVEIQSQLICASSAPVGTHLDVENLLCVSKMKAKGMTGRGVNVAIVDTGINFAHLDAHGKNPGFNATWSWKPATSTVTLGSAPVGHGTMCAFDVAIAAPNCTLLDIALLSRVGNTNPTMMGFLSDAIKAYEHLMRFMDRPVIAGENRSLVVNNSWGMFHPSWDFPVGDPGNFSSNINHPFNRIVGALAGKGADILFAAGNCGPECPDGRCQGVTNQGIYGANSHPSVTTVVGIGTNLERVGYSNLGPGKLTTNKPDVTGYTHFAGSGVWAADGGTSAATPVIAGVYAAIRTVRPLTSAASRQPSAIRNIVRTTARDIGSTGYDFMYGFGLVEGCKIVKKLFPVGPFGPIPLNFCDRFPHLCRILIDRNQLLDICKANPQLCFKIRAEIPNLPPHIDPESIKIIRNFDKIATSSALDEIENDIAALFQNQVPTKKADCRCGCQD